MNTKQGIFLVVFCLLVFCVFIGTASAATIYVPDDYPMIQEAVDAASDGDTIIVRDGIYKENVVMDKRLSLIGEDIPTIDAQVYPEYYGYGMVITTDNCLIKGLWVHKWRIFRC